MLQSSYSLHVEQELFFLVFSELSTKPIKAVTDFLGINIKDSETLKPISFDAFKEFTISFGGQSKHLHILH